MKALCGEFKDVNGQYHVCYTFLTLFCTSEQVLYPQVDIRGFTHKFDLNVKSSLLLSYSYYLQSLVSWTIEALKILSALLSQASLVIN